MILVLINNRENFIIYLIIFKNFYINMCEYIYIYIIIKKKFLNKIRIIIMIKLVIYNY